MNGRTYEEQRLKEHERKEKLLADKEYDEHQEEEEE